MPNSETGSAPGTPIVPNGAESGLSVSDTLGLLNLFERMLLAMEHRLVEKIDDQTRSAAVRWERHDKDADRTSETWGKRFEKIESDILTVANAINAHLKREEDEDLVLDARVRPVKTVAGYVIKNWRTVLLVIVSILGILGLSGEALKDFLG